MAVSRRMVFELHMASASQAVGPAQLTHGLVLQIEIFEALRR